MINNRDGNWIDVDDELPPVGEKVEAKYKDYGIEEIIEFTYAGNPDELLYISYWRQ